jgi:hypothetical protein
MTTRRRSALLLLLALAGVGVWAWGLEYLNRPTPAMQSIGDIQIAGYHHFGEEDDSGPGGNSVSSRIYVGPPISNGRLAQAVTGPGVTLKIASNPDAFVTVTRYDDIDIIGRGTAPMGCGLLVDRYIPGRGVEAWWNIDESQLAQVRAGKLNILEIDVACGTG